MAKNLLNSPFKVTYMFLDSEICFFENISLLSCLKKIDTAAVIICTMNEARIFQLNNESFLKRIRLSPVQYIEFLRRIVKDISIRMFKKENLISALSFSETYLPCVLFLSDS